MHCVYVTCTTFVHTTIHTHQPNNPLINQSSHKHTIDCEAVSIYMCVILYMNCTTQIELHNTNRTAQYKQNCTIQTELSLHFQCVPLYLKILLERQEKPDAKKPWKLLAKCLHAFTADGQSNAAVCRLVYKNKKSCTYREVCKLLFTGFTINSNRTDALVLVVSVCD
jgi:hypothetical protein